MARASTWAKFWLVQAISVGRAVGAMVFVCVAFIPDYRVVAATSFAYCALSDLLDGLIARKLRVATVFGGVLDTFGDKCLTIVSCIYGLFAGLTPYPLAFIILREVLALSLRTVVIDGAPVIRSNRVVGGLVCTTVWLATFLLLISPAHWNELWFELPYWSVAVFYLAYLPHQLRRGAPQLRSLIRQELEQGEKR